MLWPCSQVYDVQFLLKRLVSDLGAFRDGMEVEVVVVVFELLQFRQSESSLDGPHDG